MFNFFFLNLDLKFQIRLQSQFCQQKLSIFFFRIALVKTIVWKGQFWNAFLMLPKGVLMYEPAKQNVHYHGLKNWLKLNSKIVSQKKKLSEIFRLEWFKEFFDSLKVLTFNCLRHYNKSGNIHNINVITSSLKKLSTKV